MAWQRGHARERRGPRLPLPAFEFPSSEEASEVHPNLILPSTHPQHQGTTTPSPRTSPPPQDPVVPPPPETQIKMNPVPIEPGLPSSADPFADPLFGMTFHNFAVLKIGNIPYGATRLEIAHFLGRDAQADMVDNSLGTPIHIIMERSTSKTMDCYIEMKTQGAALEHFRRHWDEITGGSQRPPRIGHRLVTVDMATTDELLKHMFPRAKCVRWENGRPIILENEDPYSTGFTGYFTNEEMVGMVRHAEHPQRSPFSIKCLQRTYECMISTLQKFPWAAPDTYTLGDRNSLFITYMKLLDVLVYKVDQGNVAMLSQPLLLEYIFAGLNCRGFGERQRGLIHARGGRHAVPIQVLQIHRYWPFEVIGKKIHIKDEELCKNYLGLIENGVQVLGLAELLPSYFINAPGRMPGGLDPPIPITHFEFNERSQELKFSDAIKLEMHLMRKIFKAGYKEVNGFYPGIEEPPLQQILAEIRGEATQTSVELSMAASMERLRLQTEKLRKDSPPQSPKGTPALRDVDVVDDDNTSLNLGRQSLAPVTPTDDEPRRRLSEPQPFTRTLGDGIDITPLRSLSGSKAVPIQDPKTKVQVTPTKPSKRASLRIDDTIHEENEDVDGED